MVLFKKKKFTCRRGGREGRREGRRESEGGKEDAK
jgi:hypothetical protein